LLNNDGYGHAYGADINITKRLSKKYFGQVGYSYMQSKRNDGDGLGIYNFTYSQPHVVSLLASYKPNDKWVFSTKLRYATGRPRDSYVIHNNVFNDLNFPRSSLKVISQNSLRLKDYLSWDLRADYRVQAKTVAMTLFADIVNLPNRFNESAQLFQPITGKVYYDGATIFPTFGLRIEL
jgi:outer membrane receptor protein involved in Fe transport